MSKNVIDGKLVALSPSMLSAFDATTGFGCERRGYFRYVMGLKEPTSKGQQLGTDLHALIAERLTTGESPSGQNQAAGLYLAGEAMIEAVAKRTIIGVEKPLSPFNLDGVPVKGFNDVITSDGIIDWKTSSSRKYLKTREQLKTDMQLLIYAAAEHPTLDTIKLAHGQFVTVGNVEPKLVEVEVSKKEVDSFRDKVIIPLVQRVREVVALKEVRDAVRADDTKCFRCPFRAQCPNDESEKIMSFFSKYNKSTPKTPEDMVATLQRSIDFIDNIMPPDAPKSDPVLAADPVTEIPLAKYSVPDNDIIGHPKMTPPENIFPPPAPAKRRGRPSASKKKVEDNVIDLVTPFVFPDKETHGILEVSIEKEDALNELTVKMLKEKSEPVKKEIKDVVIKTVTVSKGCTINVGSFNSVRFDISVTGEGADFETVYGKLLQTVEERLNDEAGKYQAEVGKGNMVDAKTLVNK